MEGTIAEIRLFGGNYAPRTWALCQGQLLAIASNQALFSLIGTTYGGDGRTTFALPDLRSRTAIGAGAGNGLTNRKVGDVVGQDTVTLTTANLAAHNHHAIINSASAIISIPALADAADTANPENAVFATGEDNSGNEVQTYASTADSSGSPFTGTVSAEVTVGATGGQQPLNNLQPSLGMNYIICLQGTFPNRS